MRGFVLPTALSAVVVLAVRGAKERAVLAFLLLHEGQTVPTDRLIDEIWGEEPAESARRSLRVRIANLRRLLGSDRLLAQPSGYQLATARDTLDLDSFEELLSDAEDVGPAAAAELLREALGIWRGPTLADFRFDSWAQTRIARLEELRLVALERRIDADLAAGRDARIVGELEVLVAEYPLRERLRAQLMLALYRAGRAAEALEVYQGTRRTLVDELGIEPGQALRKLERAILRQDPSLELEQPAAPMRSLLVAALGEHKLGTTLLVLGQALARRPLRELILLRLVSERDDLAGASVDLQRLRELSLADGIEVRAAAFTSAAPADDLIRMATEQDVDLIMIEGSPGLLEDPVLSAVVEQSPCDVAILARGELQSGPVLVPFVGAEHDWSAVEIGAWLARSLDMQLRLAGPGEGQRDASSLLAAASLAVQRALGVAAEPLIAERGTEDLLRAADKASLVVVGLSDRWQTEGLGPVRSALVTDASPAVLLIRRGLRPGGLAPPGSRTRFTWTIRAAT